MTDDSSPETILVLAPTARDAAIACSELLRHGISAVSVASIDELCAVLENSGAGAALLTEDQLGPANLRSLQQVLAAQPAWSDFPLLILAGRARGSGAREHQIEGLGNVTIMQAPLKIRTLITTARSALRSRRRQYNARRAIHERDRFLAMLGHELRNPLAAITFALDTKMATEALRRRTISIIRRQTLQLARLVDDLLQVSRVSSGKIALHCERLDLARVVPRCVNSMRPRFDEAGVALVIGPSSAVSVDADPPRLEQVVNNLLTNAVKYTPRGGRVTVTFRQVGTRAQIAIEDTGVGVEADMLERIFDEFVQVDDTLARSEGGMGIGLTLVRTLVELHDGRVWAESAGSGRGSRFVVSLPLSTTPAIRHRPVAQLTRSKIPRRVALVEDNEDSRELLTELLEDLGHHVEVAVDGAAGLDLIRDSHPDAALVDIGLPKLDGYQLARKLRETVGSELHLVALSGYGQPDDRRRALEAGFDEHLTKPASVERLQQILDSL